MGRILAIGFLLSILGAGYFMSGRAGRASVKRVDQMRTAAGEPEEVEVGIMAKVAAFDPSLFATNVAADAEAFGMTDVKLTSLAAIQPHVVEIDEPIVLRAGAKWKGKRASIATSIEKVNYQQHGATVSAPHRIVTLSNDSKKPMAYKLSVGAPGTEKCQVRGSRMHNAMALRPGETAEVVVCAGRGRVRIEHLEVMTVSDLGYNYISQLSPTAVGYDTVTAHAHRPIVRVKRCDTTDPTAILRMLGTGSLRWVDVVDFYSRHNCHRFTIFEEYRAPEAAVGRLPVLPPDIPGA